MLCDFYKWIDVKEMSDYAKDNNLKLLSEYESDFWSDYIANSEMYDRAFTRMYKSYRYYDQEPYSSETSVQEVTTDFITAIYDFLSLNDKRFSELYKIKVLDDDEINVLNDYNLVETMDGTKAYQGTYVSGTRTDTDSTTLGQRSDTSSTTLGSREDNLINQKEGFNSAAFNDNTKNISQQGQQVNSMSNVIGSQQNSSSFSKGQQSDTDSHSEDNDYTLTKSGSVGNPYDNITKFQKVWTKYEFMTYIFREICADLLLV